MSHVRNLEQYRSRLQDQERAAKYSKRFESGSRRRVDRREQTAVAKILAGLPGLKSVLDVPCGAGRFAAVLGAEGRHLTGIDVSAEVLDHARERAAKAGAQAEFMQGDATKLPLERGSVDCVFCNRLLHHILDRGERGKILRELHRVTRRYAVISYFNYHAFGPVRRVLKALKGRKPPYENQPTEDEFKEEVREAGFVLKEIVLTGAPWIAQRYFVLEKREVK